MVDGPVRFDVLAQAAAGISRSGLDEARQIRAERLAAVPVATAGRVRRPEPIRNRRPRDLVPVAGLPERRVDCLSDLQHPHQKRRERLDAQRARAHAVQHLTDRRPRQPRSEQSLGNAFELRGRAQQNPDEVVPLGVPETLGGLGQPLAGGDGYGGAGGAIHAPTRRIHGERDRPRGIVPQPIAQGGGKERFRFHAGSAAPACWGPDKIRGE